MPAFEETPRLLLDRARMERNIDRMNQRVRELGVELRPHVKTAKCRQVLDRVFEGRRGPITVSTLREAEYFLEDGYCDIIYAVGIAPNKLDHVHALQQAGAELTLLLDSVAQASALAEGARRLDTHFAFLIEIDCDGHRAGIAPGDAALLEIAECARATANVELRGVLTHAGAAYDCRGEAALRAMAQRERDAVVLASERLRTAGHSCSVVSVGSTPTACFAENLDGVTELRAGAYMFMDLVMVGLGVCSLDDIAISVACSVIGHQPAKGWLITDGGWMALSRDRGTASHEVDYGYGMVCDANGAPRPELSVIDANQEHGIIADRNGSMLSPADFPVGTLLRVLPNHACAMAGMHAAYEVLGQNPQRPEHWERAQGW